MRLMLLVTCLEGGGAQQVVHDLAVALPGPVRVVALRAPSGGTDRFSARLADAGVPAVNVRMDPLRLCREIRGFRPDVLHAHLFHAHMAARTLGRLAGARSVLCTHHEVERRFRPLRPLLQRLTAPLEDASVAVSEAVAAHARTAFGIRARLIPNGIDLDRFRPRDRAEARRRLGLAPDVRVVGFVGRLHPQKGLDDLLDACRRLPADVRLLIAGEGPLRASLQRRADDRVRFLGFVEDVPGFMAALDVLAMPSRWEGFGLGLVEALACGVPVVASAVDSLPEVAGDAALLVPPGRPDLLAGALERVLEDPGDLRRRGPLRAAAYDRRRMVEAYRELYGTL